MAVTRARASVAIVPKQSEQLACRYGLLEGMAREGAELCRLANVTCN